MFNKSKLILSPLTSILFLILGTSFFMTFITVRLQEGGSNEWLIGGMHSSFYGGLLLGAYLIERAIRLIGHIRVFAVASAVTSASIIVMSLTEDAYVWMIARFVAGFCMAAHYVTIESWLLALSDAFDRGRILAIYMIGYYSAETLSQFIINYVDIAGAGPFLISTFFVSISIIPVTSTLTPQPHLHELSKFTLLKLFKTSPFGFIGSFLSGMLISCVYGFTPAFAVENELPVATLMASTILGGVLLQWPFGKVSDFIDRRLVLLVLSMLLVVPSLGIFFYAQNMYVILALSFLIGGIIYTFYPISLAQICDRVGHNDLTGVTGLTLIVYGIGSTLGPVTAPWLLVPYGTEGLFLYYALISVLMTFIGTIALIIHKPVKNHKPVTTIVYETEEG